MSQYAGKLLRKFISYRYLGFEFSAQIFPEERGAESFQTAAQVDDVDTDVVDEASNSQAKIISDILSAPIAAKNKTSRVEEKKCNLTLAECDCFMTSSEEVGEALNNFVNEKLKFLCERSLEQAVGNGSLIVEEVLRGNVDAAAVVLAKWSLFGQDCHTTVVWIRVVGDGRLLLR